MKVAGAPRAHGLVPHVAAVLMWCGGTRVWTMTELKGLRTLQLRTTQRACGWWPRAGEGYPTFAIRDRVLGRNNVGSGENTMCGRRNSSCLVALDRPFGSPRGIKGGAGLAAVWRDAWWRKTMRKPCIIPRQAQIAKDPTAGVAPWGSEGGTTRYRNQDNALQAKGRRTRSRRTATYGRSGSQPSCGARLDNAAPSSQRDA